MRCTSGERCPISAIYWGSPAVIVSVQVYGSTNQAATAAAALDCCAVRSICRSHSCRANDAMATRLVCNLLLTDTPGEPLEQALPRMSDEQQYKLGRGWARRSAVFTG